MAFDDLGLKRIDRTVGELCRRPALALYNPDEMLADLASLVAVVEADKHGAFFG